MRPLRAQRLERLVDADPSFYTDHAGTRTGLGLTFDCPIHENCFLAVPFANPLDGGPAEPRKTWQRDGDTFESLTLSPSIRILGGDEGCEWHGFIRSGLFETCGDSR